MIILSRVADHFIFVIMMSTSWSVSTTVIVSCPSVVNIGRHQAAGANVGPCYHGGGRTMMDMIEAKRSDGGQMRGVAS